MNPDSPLLMAPHFTRTVRLLLLSLALACGSALAERADRLAPMNIEADRLQYDDANQVSVFSGNVVVTQGSLILRGQQLDVRQDAQGHQRGVLTGSPTQRAFFRQQRTGLDEFVEGEAVRIDYDSLADTLTLTGQAVLRRFRGTTLSDETQGSRIIYNGALETFSVEGGAAGRSAANPAGRVRALLSPTPAPEATPSTAPSAAPAPQAPRPALTPSQRLEQRP